MKMNILVPNINRCGQKDLSLKVRHKAYACPLGVIVKSTPITKNTKFDASRET